MWRDGLDSFPFWKVKYNNLLVHDGMIFPDTSHDVFDVLCLYGWGLDQQIRAYLEVYILAESSFVHQFLFELLV